MKNAKSQNRIWDILVSVLFTVAATVPFPLADMRLYLGGAPDDIRFVSMTAEAYELLVPGVIFGLLYFVLCERKEKLKAADYVLLALAVLCFAAGLAVTGGRRFLTFVAGLFLLGACDSLYCRLAKGKQKLWMNAALCVLFAIIIVVRVFFGTYVR